MTPGRQETADRLSAHPAVPTGAAGPRAGDMPTRSQHPFVGSSPKGPRVACQDLPVRHLRAVLIRINQITRGWANYFKHAIAKRTFSKLQHYTWWRIVRMMLTRHRWKWKDVRHWLTDHTGRWHPISANGNRTVQPRNDTHHPVPLPGQQDPQPLGPGCLNQPTAGTMESPSR